MGAQRLSGHEGQSLCGQCVLGRSCLSRIFFGQFVFWFVKKNPQIPDSGVIIFYFKIFFLHIILIDMKLRVIILKGCPSAIVANGGRQVAAFQILFELIQINTF